MSSSSSPPSWTPDDDIKIKLLSIPECFVYRIPPLKTAGGHRAEDWDLAKPLQTCSLLVERDNADTCFVKLYTTPVLDDTTAPATPTLFAQCTMSISNDSNASVAQFCEGVMDSLRYFVLRISSASTDRVAHVGMGFRERDDASNFRLTLQDFEQSVRRSKQAMQMQQDYNDQQQGVAQSATSSIHTATMMSKLTLQEGEKIHVNLGNRGGTTTTSSITKEKPKSNTTTTSGTALPLLKKKPPPSPSISSSTSNSCDANRPQRAPPGAREYAVRSSMAPSSGGSEVGSEGAVGSLTSEEDWNDDGVEEDKE